MSWSPSYYSIYILIYLYIYDLKALSLFKIEHLPFTTSPDQNPHSFCRVQTFPVCLSIWRGKDLEFKMHDVRGKLHKTIFVSQQNWFKFPNITKQLRIYCLEVHCGTLNTLPNRCSYLDPQEAGVVVFVQHIATFGASENCYWDHSA